MMHVMQAHTYGSYARHLQCTRGSRDWLELPLHQPRLLPRFYNGIPLTLSHVHSNGAHLSIDVVLSVSGVRISELFI